MNNPSYSIHFFESKLRAIAYRHTSGCGGWIFTPEDQGAPVALFPHTFTPSKILAHPVTRGVSGQLDATSAPAAPAAKAVEDMTDDELCAELGADHVGELAFSPQSIRDAARRGRGGAPTPAQVYRAAGKVLGKARRS